MFSLDVVNTDKFLDLSVSAQCLYFHLGMRADDDGFIPNPKQIMRMVTCTQEDIEVLTESGFIIPFESGVVVIRHWKQHNYIQSDRYRQTKYTKEREQLQLVENVYRLDTERIQNVSETETQYRLGKDRVRDSIELNNNICSDSAEPSPEQTNKKFIPPTLEEVKQYCKERNNAVDAQSFIDFYESKGWMIGKNKMKNWKAAVRTWERNNKQTVPEDNLGQRPNYKHDFDIILPSSPDDPFK